MVSRISNDKQSINNKKVIIIGAGPGGLAAGMLLASKGYSVNIYEKQKKVACYRGNGFTNYIVDLLHQEQPGA